jgi:hypothetical protein
MTEAEKKREEILQFLLAWDAEQAVNPWPEPLTNLDLAASDDPVVRALSCFPRVTLH